VQPGSGSRGQAAWLAAFALAAAAAVTSASALAATSPPAAAVASAAPESRTLLIGAEDDAAPWSYADGTGYVNDLVTAAFREVGWTVRLKVVPYVRCKALAVQGRLAGCFTVGRTPEVEAELLFPQTPVLRTRNVLVARAKPGDAWTGCQPEAWGRRPRVGLVRGYEYLPVIETLFPVGGPQVEIADSEVSNLRKLRADRLDAALVTLDEVKRLDYLARLAGISPDFRTVCDFGTLPSYVAFSRRHPQGEAARAAFDEGMRRLEKRGGTAALQAVWRDRAVDAAAAKKH
jgi:ABC-type amino acid transport substrate-binding protein